MFVEPSASYRVKLEHFEGPLDLLLYLIKKNELDICEVSLTRIADQYLHYVNTMELLNLEIAGEFILVAATLMLMKSRALLPSEASDLTEEEDDLESPAELIRRLLLYKKYKDGALQLRERNTLFDKVFLRGSEDPILASLKEAAPTLELSIFVLLEAFQKILQKTPLSTVHEIQGENITLGQRIKQIYTQLQAAKDLPFEALFAGVKSRSLVVVTFLAILEMSRLALLRIYQNESFKTIHLESLTQTQGEGYDRVQGLLAEEEKNFTYGGDT